MSDQAWLEDYIRHTGAVAGTVHRYEEGGLRLAAALNIPPKVCEIVTWVPAGKGMAGQALVTAKPVFTCNLRNDPSAAVLPGARAVDAKAAIALPIPDASGQVMAVVGVAFSSDHDFGPDEIEHLTRLGASVLADPYEPLY